MKIRRYQISVEGMRPLILHHDDIEWADYLKAWRGAAENKQGSVKGDDRSPAHTWIGSLYHDGKFVSIPAEMITASLRDGGGLTSTGSGNKTFKAQSQSGIAVAEPYAKLLAYGKPIPFAPVEKLMRERDFATHKRAVEKMGFQLLIRPVKIKGSRHIRVRPQFLKWSCLFELIVTDDAITQKILETILTNAGMYRGWGDWRPGQPSPGTYGTWRATVKPINPKR